MQLCVVAVASPRPPFTSSAGANLAEHLVHYPKVKTMAEVNSRGDGLGVPATDRNRQTSKMALMLEAHAVHYSEQMMTFPGPGAKSIDALKNQFEKQLLCWEKVLKMDENDPLAKVAFKWTAKHATEDRNDDLAVTGLMLPYWSSVFYQNPMYTPWIAANVQPRHGAGANGSIPDAHVPPPAQRGNGGGNAYYSPMVLSDLLSTNRAFLAPTPMGAPAPAAQRHVAAIQQLQQRKSVVGSTPAAAPRGLLPSFVGQKVTWRETNSKT